MKTIRYNTQFARMLAGLAMLTIAGFIQAEEPGIVRLTDLADETVYDAAESAPLVIRGQSDLRRRNAQTSQALRQFFATASVQPAGMIHSPATAACNSCDCCPPVGESCCPVPSCDTINACCAPTCEAPASCCDVPACCPNVCDGCDASGGYGGTNVCPQCGGNGCRACLGRRGGRNGRYGESVCPHCNSSPCQCGRGSGGLFGGSGGLFGGSGGLFGGSGGLFGGACANHQARNRQASATLNAYLRCRLGYFIHDGSGGGGSPIFGHYKVVYPVNPGYFDDRDGQVYAAPGYGGPVSVPLAPVVRHAYNYGWGIPSSRLTPISNTVTP